MNQYITEIFKEDRDLLERCQEGDVIIFDMPSFCSGDYNAKVHKDDGGLYIKKRNNYLKGCRDYFLFKPEV